MDLEGFNCSMDDVEDFMDQLEKSIYSFSTDYIKKVFRDINTNLIRRFNQLFKKDEQGKNRDWRAIDEGQIRDLFAKIKTQMEEVINEFKYIKIPKNTN